MAETKKTEQKQKEVKITVPESVQAGRFTNVARINATATEVTFDFAHVPPESEEGTDSDGPPSQWRPRDCSNSPRALPVLSVSLPRCERSLVFPQRDWLPRRH